MYMEGHVSTQPFCHFGFHAKCHFQRQDERLTPICLAEAGTVDICDGHLAYYVCKPSHPCALCECKIIGSSNSICTRCYGVHYARSAAPVTFATANAEMQHAVSSYNDTGCMRRARLMLTPYMGEYAAWCQMHEEIVRDSNGIDAVCTRIISDPCAYFTNAKRSEEI